MNKCWAKSLRIRALVLGLAVLCGAPFAGAQAHLISTMPATAGCDKDSPAGTNLIGTVRDPAGNIFTLNCVNGLGGAYFQGSVFEITLNLLYNFGRCLYKTGTNAFNFETDENNIITGIEWANVEPPQHTVASREKVQADLPGPLPKDTKAWLAEVDAYVTKNNLNATIYDTLIGAADYTITSYSRAAPFTILSGAIIPDPLVLTKATSDQYYGANGTSTLSLLTIANGMGTSEDTSQATTTGVPEPNATTIFVFALIALGFLVKLKDGNCSPHPGDVPAGS